MKLTAITRIRKEDMPEAPDWIEKVIYPLNRFIENVYSAFRGSIDFNDNVKSEIREFTLNTTDFPFKFKPKFIPNMIFLGQILQVAGDHVDLTSTPFPDWEYGNDGLVTLYTITNLTVGEDYKIKLLLI
jgi:hypothetical protein